MKFDRKKFIQSILEILEKEHLQHLNAAREAHNTATNEENIPEHKYDTLALEASYLAQGQADRAQELSVAIEKYKALLKIAPASSTEVQLGSLVELLKNESETIWVFIGPDHGGLKINWDGKKILVITPQSPLGENLMGYSEGKTFEIEQKNLISYEILGLHS